MRAVVYEQYGGPEVLHVKEVEKPSPEANEVLIKIGGSAINPVDTYFRKGIRQVPSFPHIPHFDLGGVVEEVGEKVEGVKVGDRVWATNVSGSCAEYVVADGDLVFPLNESFTEIDGAAIAMPFITAHLSLHFRAGVKSGDTVLIYGGAGAVGNAAIQLAKNAGSFVIATAGDEEKAALCSQAGADEVILYKESDVVADVLALTENAGVHIILDMSLSENMEKDLAMIKIGGRIVTIGSPVNNEPVLPWRLLNQKHASLMGILLFTAPKEEIVKAGREISELMAEGEISAHVGATFSFDQAAEAHTALESKRVNGSIVLVP